MIDIRTQRQLQRLRRLGFCYLCGDQIERNETTRDHVVASRLILPQHRTPPLILPTHRSCNHKWAVSDGHMAELSRVLHGIQLDDDNLQLDYVIAVDPETNEEVGAASGVNIEHIVARWVQGFHAAMYGEYLPPIGSTRFCISTPFPRGGIERDSGRPVFEPLQPVHVPLCRCIQANRAAGRIDRLSIYDGNVVYECVWDVVEQGGVSKPACVFAIKFYNWEELGSTPITAPRGCVGLYVPQGSPPVSSARSSPIDTSMIQFDNFNPFRS